MVYCAKNKKIVILTEAFALEGFCQFGRYEVECEKVRTL